MQIYCNIHKHADMDSFLECDEENANPTYLRIASISIKVDKNWLTCDRDYELTDESWKTLEEDISSSLQRVYSTHGQRFPKVPELSWEEWDGEADELP